MQPEHLYKIIVSSSKLSLYIYAMKQNQAKYREVTKLPTTAKTVKTYAENEGITTAYVYKMLREKKNKFEIVVFQGVNFIIP